MSSITLRPTASADLDFVVDAERLPEVAPFIEAWPRDRHAAALADPDLVTYIVETDGLPVGFVLLAGLTSPHASVELRRVVVTEPGRGYGRATLRAVKRLAFGPLGARRLWLDVKPANTRAHALYLSEGFAEEGLLRGTLRTPDGLEPLRIMAALSPDVGAQKGLYN